MSSATKRMNCIVRLGLAVVAVWMTGGMAINPARAAVAFVTSAVTFPTNEIARHACNSLSVVLSNTSAQSLTGLVAILTTTTPGIEITQPGLAYTNIPANGLATNALPFKIGTAQWSNCGAPINLALTVTRTNVFTNVLAFQQSTPANCLDGRGGCPCTNTFANGISQTELWQMGQLFAHSPSSCTNPLACPGVQPDLEPRRYDAYPFFNQHDVDACVTVEVTGTCSLSAYFLFSAAYLDRFAPLDICANYLADVGQPITNGASSYKFVAPAGRQFVVVVNEVTAGSGCPAYTIKISSTASLIEYRPRLSIMREDPYLIVSWPTNATGYTLFSAPDLGTNGDRPDYSLFQPVAAPQGRLDENVRVTNSSFGSEPRRLYLLRKP